LIGFFGCTAFSRLKITGVRAALVSPSMPLRHHPVLINGRSSDLALARQASSGIARTGSFKEVAVAVVERAMTVNYFGALSAFKSDVPGMWARGRSAGGLVSSGARLNSFLDTTLTRLRNPPCAVSPRRCARNGKARVSTL
jgi:hypothetical protein